MPTPIGLHLALVLAIATFAVAPQIDAEVSNQFYHAQGGFWLAALPAAKIVRELFRASGNLFGMAGGLLFALSLLIGHGRKVPTRIWGFWFGTMALGPGIAVNLLLKPLWGRARPADTTIFGGTNAFTPALLPTDQCHWGCSFVSGEAAAAVGVAIVLGVLLYPRLAKRGRIALGSGLCVYTIAVSGLRIAMGRHFLSDVIFGWLVAAYTGWALYRALGIRVAREELTCAGAISDARSLAGRLSWRRQQ
ncbi:MAG: phosphatase PAP2 family protein [Rhodobacteraceae bacterium]|nr:phosphatase PAP2 family protein [Paracoccaceae bacterium]